MMSGNNNTGGG
jgi:cullin 3